MNQSDVSHLYVRAAFETPSSARESSSITLNDHLDWLINSSVDNPSSDENHATSLKQLELQWHQHLLRTQTPLAEKMTIFWHNHFACSFDKLKNVHLMERQVQTFRKHSLGNFRDLLGDMLNDPALLICLDNVTNQKKSPNENLARELLELYTIGDENFTEQDVIAISRVLTGASTKKNTPKSIPSYSFKKPWHDTDKKNYLGFSGNFGPSDLPHQITSMQQCSDFICKKLWAYFVSPTPNKDAIAELSKTFYSSGYEIKPVLRQLFSSPYFFDKESRNRLVKSPTELIVGAMRTYSIPPLNYQQYLQFSTGMQQRLLFPPSVKGWPTGTDWINTSTLNQRLRFAEYVKSKKPDTEETSNLFKTSYQLK